MGPLCPSKHRKIPSIKNFKGGLRVPEILYARILYVLYLLLILVCAMGKIKGIFSASSKPTTEFAQPRLSRVKRRSSPARGYKFGCVCSYLAGHYPGILMTGHIGTNKRPNLYPLAGDDRRLWETDFYTPPVLGGAALFDNSAPAVYEIQGP